MNRLPPKYITVPSAIAYGLDNCAGLPAVVRMTWIMLRGMAWGRNSVNVTMQDMMEVTGLKRSAVYAHLRLLRDCSSLLWASHGDSDFQLRFPEDNTQSIFLDCPSSSSLNINLPVNNQSTTATDNSLLIPRAIQKTGRQSEKTDANGWRDVLTDGMTHALDALGVTRALFPEVAEVIRSGRWPVAAVTALIDDCRAGRKPGGLFIHRLRNEDPPQGEACPVCGKIGTHKPDCRLRYTAGQFAEYINN